MNSSGFAEDLDAKTQPVLSSRARLSKTICKSYTQSAAENGDENDLWLSAASHIPSTSLRFTQSSASDPMEPFEGDMHDLWHLYIHASMNIGDQRAEQDRLVVQILQARELGVLVRAGENVDTYEEAVTRDGRIWQDLPFLASDMTDFWLQHSQELSKAQRQNLASFLAKLSAVGVRGDELCGLALIIMRDALESKRPLGLVAPVLAPTSDSQRHHKGQGGKGSNYQLSIADLLPAANSWLFNASQKIIRLSENSIDIFPAEVGMLGDLVKAVGVVPENGGFSPQRWLFWLKRLEEIGRSKDAEGHEPEIAEFARRMVSNMTIPICESESAMKRELARQNTLPFEA